MQSARNEQAEIYKILDKHDQKIAQLISKYSDPQGPGIETQLANSARPSKATKQKKASNHSSLTLEVAQTNPKQEAQAKSRKHRIKWNKDSGRDKSELRAGLKSPWPQLHFNMLALPLINAKHSGMKPRHRKQASIDASANKFKARDLYRIYGHSIEHARHKAKSQSASYQAKSRHKHKQLREEQPNKPREPAQSLWQVQSHNKKEDIDSFDQQSEAQQADLKQYEKQFRQKMKDQCLEEMNFLQFGRNRQMKEWTESLLALLQKHDKQMAMLRHRTKYLSRFDHAFFSAGIFQAQTL